jgi:hypothetical protein
MILTALLYLLMIVPCIELIFASAQQTPSLHVPFTCDFSNDQNQADGNAECLGTDAFGEAVVNENNLEYVHGPRAAHSVAQVRLMHSQLASQWTGVINVHNITEMATY